MKKALISPNESVSYISSWSLVGDVYRPIFTVVGERVAEVADQEFEVALPLFWTACADETTTSDYYYDAASQRILPVPTPAPYPAIVG